MHSDAFHWLSVLAGRQRSHIRRFRKLEYSDEDTTMVACQPVSQLPSLSSLQPLSNFRHYTLPHASTLPSGGRSCCLSRPVCVPCLHLKFTLYLQQPTKGKWLELAGPHLDGSSYVHCLLEQQQEQGEEFRVQFFLDG